MLKVLTPPTYEDVKGPVIFLAGPIQGVVPWQDRAIEHFTKLGLKATIANPRRSDETWHYQFDIQVDWETYYLDRASKEGVILFWLAKETDHSCERAYAQTTRFELAEWLTKYKVKPFNLCLGIEEGFTGARYIRHRMETDEDKAFDDILIHRSLEGLCEQIWLESQR